MRIEIDTKHDTKEELAHLANMLKALSGNRAGSFISKEPRIPKEKPRNIFDDPSPSGGFMGMFGASKPAPEPSSTQTDFQSSPQPAVQPEPSGGVFSLFGAPDVPSSPLTGASEPTVSELLSANEPVDLEEKQTSAQSLLDDDRVMPY